MVGGLFLSADGIADSALTEIIIEIWLIHKSKIVSKQNWNIYYYFVIIITNNYYCTPTVFSAIVQTVGDFYVPI